MGMKRELDIGSVPFQISDGSVEIKFAAEGQTLKGIEFYQGMRYAHSHTAPIDPNKFGFLQESHAYVEYGGHLPTWVWSNSEYTIDVTWAEEI